METASVGVDSETIRLSPLRTKKIAALAAAGLILLGLGFSLTSRASVPTTADQMPPNNNVHVHVLKFTPSNNLHVLKVTPSESALNGGTPITIHMHIAEGQNEYQALLESLRNALVEGRLWCKFSSFAALSQSKVTSMNVLSDGLVLFQCITPARGCANLCSDPKAHAAGIYGPSVTEWPKVEQWAAASWVDIVMNVDSSPISGLVPYDLEGPSYQFVRINRGDPGVILFWDTPGKSDLKLNVAHGRNLLDGWVNLDTEPAAQKEKSGKWTINVLWMADFLLGGFRDSSVSVVNIAHTLIYLQAGHAERLVQDIFRVLKPGGIFRLSEDTPMGRCPCVKAMSTSCETDSLQMLKRAGFETRFYPKDQSGFPDPDIFRLYHGWGIKGVNSPLFVLEGVKPH